MPQQQLDPHMWEIDKLFENKIYNVPVYQRPYSWNIENVEILLNDIFDAYNSPQKIEGYYTGNLLLHDKNEKINGIATIYEVIDGQQRITTIALILLALYSITTLRKGQDDDVYRDIKKYLWKKITKRQPEKEYKVVNLNSTEKKCFDDLFNYAFDHPDKIYDYAKNYETTSSSEKFVIGNFIKIHDKISTEQITSKTADDILDYAKYILENVRFIAIECRCNVNKVFSMFESINSKGKKLDEIDLIKTYIFSKLDEESYDEYLSKWGQLIIKTDNNLYDYFYTYIRAFITFYRQNIKINNFKAMSEWSLSNHFGKNSLCDTFKAFIDDMVNKVDYYIMLSSYEKASDLISSKRFRFYYKVFSGTYTHPKPLFMRVLYEYSVGNISKDDTIDIFEQIVKYMIKFTNIADLESKEVINLFSNIMNNIYETDEVDKNYIYAQIANETMIKGIDDKAIAFNLSQMDAYEKNKKVSTALLALYESMETSDGGKISISYDKAYILVEKFSEAFSLDHLLVQTPDKDDFNYKYYCDTSNNTEVLRLKEGNDFPKNITDGMPYDTFKHTILNKIANLRIYYQDKNSGRSNTAIELKEYGEFHNYKDIETRENSIIPVLVNNVLKTPTANLSLISKKKKPSKLPGMDKLIDEGLVNIGDQLYITLHPDNSIATLIDTNKVEFNGEVMSINEWAKKIIGWTAVRTYSYVARVGETETLHQKREKII